MINLEQIVNAFPPGLNGMQDKMLAEYLQYKILEIIFRSEFGKKLCFLGGTTIRIVHSSTRFSEDLDFDNFNMSKEEFVELTEIIAKELNLAGYNVEVRNVFKGAYRCYIKFSDILFQNKLSSQRDEKLTIQVDTVAHEFDFVPDKVTLNKWEYFFDLRTTPKNLLLSQKICAAFGRKRPKGRDFYDITFLMGIGAKPDFDYLQKTLGIADGKKLKLFMLKESEKLDFSLLVRDVRQFLFYERDKVRIEGFLDYIKTVEF